MGLLMLIDRYLRSTGMSASRFGREAMGDASFVATLRRGRDCRPKTVARVRAFLERRSVEREGRP